MKQSQWSLNRKQVTPILRWRPSHVSSFHLEEKPKPFQQPPKPYLIWHHTPASGPLLPPTPSPSLGSSHGQPPDWSQDALCPDTSPPSPRLPLLDSELILQWGLSWFSLLNCSFHPGSSPCFMSLRVYDTFYVLIMFCCNSVIWKNKSIIFISCLSHLNVSAMKSGISACFIYCPIPNI